MTLTLGNKCIDKTTIFVIFKSKQKNIRKINAKTDGQFA
jgi:hypothetical protein